MAVAIGSNLAKLVAGKPLLTDVSFKVERGDRLTLSGRNGSGKTTLLRMLAGETPIDEGQLSIEKGATIALHDQRPPRDQQLTLREYVLTGCAELVALEEQLARLEQAMGEGASDQATLDAYASRRDGSSTPAATTGASRTMTVVRRLGFRTRTSTASCAPSRAES